MTCPGSCVSPIRPSLFDGREMRIAVSDPARWLFAAMVCWVLMGVCPIAGAQTLSVFSCDGPLGFDACHTTGRGELQCEITNKTAELVVPQRNDQFFAWAYDGAGVLLSSDDGNYAYPGQIVPFGTGLVTFPMAPRTAKVVLCVTDPEENTGDQILHQVTENATRTIDLVMVTGLIIVLIGGLLPLYLTLYGVFTGRLPNFKRKKTIKRLLRIRWGQNIAESIAEDWVIRDESPFEFWLSVLAGLLTAAPLLAFSIPLLLEELW